MLLRIGLGRCFHYSTTKSQDAANKQIGDHMSYGRQVNCRSLGAYKIVSADPKQRIGTDWDHAGTDTLHRTETGHDMGQGRDKTWGHGRYRAV